jgi:hypothetical protein
MLSFLRTIAPSAAIAGQWEKEIGDGRARAVSEELLERVAAAADERHLS